MSVPLINRLLLVTLLAIIPIVSQAEGSRDITVRIWRKHGNEGSNGFVVTPIQESRFKTTGTRTEILFRRAGTNEWLSFDISEIERIDYSLRDQQPPGVADTGTPVTPSPAVNGRWVGNYRNSIGGSGSSTLVIYTTSDGISGTLDGDAFKNAMWDGRTLRWSYVSAGQVTYTCQLTLSGDKTAFFSYTASSASKAYHGSVENYVRQ